MNKKWKTTKSGLKYQVMKKGEGPKPKAGQAVFMHYELWAGDGVTSSNYDYDAAKYVDNIYDSTYDERNPFSGPVEIKVGALTPKDEVYTKGESIKGINEALLSMKVGEKRALFIPADLAYGIEGASSFHTFHGYRTPPNQPIRCNIELASIVEDKTEKSQTNKSQSGNVAYEG